MLNYFHLHEYLFQQVKYTHLDWGNVFEIKLFLYECFTLIKSLSKTQFVQCNYTDI